MKTRVVQTIAFGIAGNAQDHQLCGWSNPEPDHTWSIGASSSLWVPVPDLPHGFFLELDWTPAVLPPVLSAQPVTVMVNGQRVFAGDVHSATVAAFDCSAIRATGRGILVQFEHGDAVSPKMFGSTDDRILGFCVRRLRVLAIEGHAPPRPCWPLRQSSIRLGSPHSAGLAEETERQTGGRLRDVLTHFETLAGNCDMGLVQRALGAEPLSLLRFAGTRLGAAIRGLDTAFAGIGDALQPWESPEGEWMMRNGYGLNYHTGQQASDVPATRIIEMEQVRLAFLQRKFMRDLSEGEKTYVMYDVFAAARLVDVMALFLALSRHGRRRLLWVVPCPYPERQGKVEEILPGLFLGHLGQFERPTVAYISIKGWLDVLVNAWLLEQRSGHSGGVADFAASALEAV